MESCNTAIFKLQFISSDFYIFPGSVDKCKRFLVPLTGHFNCELMSFRINFHIFYGGNGTVMIDNVTLVIRQIGNGNRRIFCKHIGSVLLSDTGFCICPVIQQIPRQRRIKFIYGLLRR